jgi:hypothetical protein
MAPLLEEAQAEIHLDQKIAGPASVAATHTNRWRGLQIARNSACESAIPPFS